MEPKQTSELYFQAGELLRKETQEISESLANLLQSATTEDWATAARDTVGRGELQWPNRLIEKLKKCQSIRLTSEIQVKRIQRYVAEKERTTAGRI